MPRQEAKAYAVNILERFGLSEISEKRRSSLTPDEQFCVMLTRAAMVRGAEIVLDRPFRILPDRRDGRFFIDALEKIDDLFAEAYIFDYSWDKERYGITDDAED